MDTEKYISNIIPVHRKKAKAVAAMKVLMQPLNSLYASLDAYSDGVLDIIRNQSQAVELGFRLDKVAGLPNGTIIVRNSKTAPYDIEIVVPSNLSLTLRKAVLGYANRFRLSGMSICLNNGVEIISPHPPNTAPPPPPSCMLSVSSIRVVNTENSARIYVALYDTPNAGQYQYKVTRLDTNVVVADSTVGQKDWYGNLGQLIDVPCRLDVKNAFTGCTDTRQFVAHWFGGVGCNISLEVLSNDCVGINNSQRMIGFKITDFMMDGNPYTVEFINRLDYTLIYSTAVSLTQTGTDTSSGSNFAFDQFNILMNTGYDDVLMRIVSANRCKADAIITLAACAPARPSAWVVNPTSVACELGVDGKNTGKKIWAELMQVYTDVSPNVATGMYKPNIVGDANYVAGVEDLVICPINQPNNNTLSVINSLAYQAMSAGSGLSIGDIPNFQMGSYESVYGMFKSANGGLFDELNRGFTRIYTGITGGLQASMTQRQRLNFMNMGTEVVNLGGDWNNLDTITDQMCVTVGNYIGIVPEGWGGAVLDGEVWGWAGSVTYHQKMAHIHSLILKQLWNQAQAQPMSDRFIAMWGPYTAIEVSFDDNLYDNPLAGVVPTWTATSLEGWRYWDYITHVIVGNYFSLRDGDLLNQHDSSVRERVAAETTYKHLFNFEVNKGYLATGKKMCMAVYLHFENSNDGLGGAGGSHYILPDWTVEFLAIFNRFSGADAEYCWSEYGFVDNIRNWNAYKHYIVSKHRVSQINSILDDTPVFLREQTMVSYDGGVNFQSTKLKELHDAQKPIVRNVVSASGKVAIAAINTYGAVGQSVSVVCRINGIDYTVNMIGRNTTLLADLS